MKRLALALLLVTQLSAAAALPVVDLSEDTARHVVLARGTADTYQGHPTTLLMPDGKTVFATWTLGHGGTCGPLKRSDDGGRTWSELLPVPDNWKAVRNCPALYRLTDPQGVSRLFIFAGQGPDGAMQQSVSTDDGKTWSPMKSNGLVCVMPFCTIAPVEGGKKLIGLTNIRRPGETKDPSLEHHRAKRIDRWRPHLDASGESCSTWANSNPASPKLFAHQIANNSSASFAKTCGPSQLTT